MAETIETPSCPLPTAPVPASPRPRHFPRQGKAELAAAGRGWMVTGLPRVTSSHKATTDTGQATEPRTPASPGTGPAPDPDLERSNPCPSNAFWLCISQDLAPHLSRSGCACLSPAREHLQVCKVVFFFYPLEELQPQRLCPAGSSKPWE